MQLPSLNYQVLQSQAGKLNDTIITTRQLKQIGLVIVAIVLLLALTRGALHSAAVTIVIVGIIVGALIMFWQAGKTNRARREALAAFAAANNLSIQFEVPEPQMNGMMFQVGRDRNLEVRLTIPTDSTPLEFGNYRYTVGEGKNKRTNEIGYVRLKLPRQLPNMVLDAHFNNLGSLFSNLPESFNRDQTLKLEGNFNEYFTLYAPQEYEQDALYIFTPDVMATLIDKAHKFDMEIIDDDLYLYHTVRLNLANPTVLQDLMELSKQLDEQIRKQATSYADERVGNRDINQVSQPGRRLKSGTSWLVIAVVVVYFAINVLPSLGQFFSLTLGWFISLAIGIAVWLGIGWVVHYLHKRRKQP